MLIYACLGIYIFFYPFDIIFTQVLLLTAIMQISNALLHQRNCRLCQVIFRDGKLNS